MGCVARPGAPAVARDPAWAVALGIARYAAEQRDVPAPASRGGLGRALRWVRDWFE